MTDLLTVISARLAFLPALLLTPYLAARRLKPSLSLVPTVALTGLLSISLNTAAPVALHLSGIPVTAGSLAITHILIFISVLALNWYMRTPLLPVQVDCNRQFFAFAALFVFMVLPITNLAGIDTYKWQGLATNVSVQASIPWLVSPFSLLGFTPRSYPSIQPLVLASSQLLGGLGVRGGFFTVSVLSGITGMCSAWCLGRKIGKTPDYATLFSIIFTFSPVFMRYNHWATGRGFFLSIMPVFLLSILRRPGLGAFLLSLASGILLCLSHKAGPIAVVIIPLSLLASFIPLGRRHILVASIACVTMIMLSTVISAPYLMPAPFGNIFGLMRSTLTRFFWLLPIALLGLITTGEWTIGSTSRKRLFCLLVLTIPIAHAREMYGALLAMIFVALAASDGLVWLMDRFTAWKPALKRGAICLSITGSLVIVAHRSINAAPECVVTAAGFLNKYDPSGPYRIDAPGRIRVQIHAYALGCPRFSVRRQAGSGIRFNQPPSWTGHPATILQEWIDYLRVALEVQDIDTSWYGNSPRIYYVVIDGNGNRPKNGHLLFNSGGVEIYAPKGQKEP